MASTVFNIIGPKILGKATTKLFEGVMGEIAGTGTGIDFGYIGQILLLTLALYLGSSLFALIQGWIMSHIAMDITYRFRNDIADKINREAAEPAGMTDSGWQVSSGSGSGGGSGGDRFLESVLLKCTADDRRNGYDDEDDNVSPLTTYHFGSRSGTGRTSSSGGTSSGAAMRIDLLGFAVLSNHFHLILRSRPDVVGTWDDTEVARRWLLRKACSTSSRFSSGM